MGVVFNLGADGEVVVRSLISPINAEDIDGIASGGNMELEFLSSSSSDKSTVNRVPRKSMVMLFLIAR